MNPQLITYFTILIISIFLSFKFAKNRYIGVFWSIVFSIFCPFFSIIFIFLSKIKRPNGTANNLTFIGLGLLVFLAFSLFSSSTSIESHYFSLKLPLLIITDNLTSEKFGYYIGENVIHILPIYALLRNFTMKFLP